ncbi:MAG TPA: hypothetical protein VLA83_02890 [Candidatus Binatia bacterium]|nr:hypothetical protein [Candidatus Binatia bacterium]
MPRKHKPRKPVASPDEVWIAPRPANSSEPRTFEPAAILRSNRYLEFADIALGTNEASRKKKKKRDAAGHIDYDHHPESKVTPINRARGSHPRGPNQGFGAFRNPR